MTDPADSQPPDEVSSGFTPRMRIAGLGLLVVAALIAVVVIFGGDDSDGGSGQNDSSQASVTSAQSSSSAAAPSSAVITTEPAPTSAAPSSTDSTAGQTQPAVPANVVVLITSQGWNADTHSIEVVGAVQGVATQTSTCTATATAASGAGSKQASVPGAFDGQGTSCGLIVIPMEGMPAGTYQVVITFDAGSGAVGSAPVSVDVP